MSGNITSSSFFSISFISAKSPELLEIDCLKNNLKNNRVYHYRDIQFVKGLWYAWYDRDQRHKIKIKTKE